MKCECGREHDESRKVCECGRWLVSLEKDELVMLTADELTYANAAFDPPGLVMVNVGEEK